MLYRIGIPMLWAALLTACGPPEQRYELKGRVTAVDVEGGNVTVSHGAIPGLMDAMTMPFPVLRRRILASAQVGDDIQATLVVKGNSHWLEDVVLSRRLAEADDVPKGPEIGSEVPDIELVNQDAEPVRLSDFRGKGLLITFIYTRCPLADFCPRMTNHFSAIEEALASQPRLYANTHLLTVSFDPDFDTPELLRKFALQQPAVSEETLSHWTFATATQENLGTIASYLGLTYQEADDQIVHNLRTAFIAPDGTLAELYTGNAWTPEDILTDVTDFFSES
jgi:protein SCO1/2